MVCYSTKETGQTIRAAAQGQLPRHKPITGGRKDLHATGHRGYGREGPQETSRAHARERCARGRTRLSNQCETERTHGDLISLNAQSMRSMEHDENMEQETQRLKCAQQKAGVEAWT